MAKSKSMKAIIGNLTKDQVIAKRDGTFSIRRGYFYRHGMSAERFASGVVLALQRGGLDVDLVDSHDMWNPWPRDSYFEAIVRITENPQDPRLRGILPP